MPTQSEIINQLKGFVAPDISIKPNDIIPQDQPEPNIDKDELSRYLVKITKQDIQVKENFGFGDKKVYDIQAYEGIKNKFMENWPHPHASAYPVPITTVHLNIGYTQILNTMFRDRLKTVYVSGVSKEDESFAPLIAHVHNWQNSMESNIYDVQSANIFRTLLHGTGHVKTLIKLGENYSVKHASIPLELILKPIKQDGCQKDETDHITQIIPMTENDWKSRINLKLNDKSVYDNLDLLSPGFEYESSINKEEINMLKSQITGLDVSQIENTEMRYMMETHLTYYPPKSIRAIELVVWWSFKHGIIHRVIKNEEEIRSLASYKIYPDYDFAFHRSLPRILRNVQEKANYTDKQVSDASDIAIQPETFIEEGSGFDASQHVKVLNGMYEVRKGTKITVMNRNISPIIQRQGEIANLWREAEQLDGFTDLFQGVLPRTKNTLGADRLRFSQSQARFKTLMNTFGIGWSETQEIQYYYNDKYLPVKKAVKILGSSEYTNLKQIFPNNSQDKFGLNLEYKFNFSISKETQDEVEEKQFLYNQFLNEIIAYFGKTNEATLWKAMKEKARIIDFNAFERIVPKPIEANIINIEEMLQKIESGEENIVPSPLINAKQYLIELNTFKQFNDKYFYWDNKKKAVFARLIARIESIDIGNSLAEMEDRAKKDPEYAGAFEEAMNELSERFGLETPANIKPVPSSSKPITVPVEVNNVI